jgi:dUTP pyrophosphatase
MQVQVKRIHSFDLPLPEYMTPGASGMDLYAAVENELCIPAGKFALIPTGLAMSIPGGYEGQIRPRSGLALRHGITLLNTPGTIDADYRGEIKVIVINLGDREYILKKGERIAQIVFSKIEKVQLIEHKNLDDTSRGKGGFGHTGT